MYRPGTPQYEYHLQTYGGPEKFGYKDFIPLFTAQRFDPDEWAEQFQRSGAQYAGPVAEHHDGFAMWDTLTGEWNAARMGPRRDVVALLAESIRRQGLRFLTAFHHAENWWFYPHWQAAYDTSDPRYAGLYGEAHNLAGPLSAEGFFNQDPPSRAFLERWQARLLEVVERFRPDLIWFDFGLRGVPDHYKMEFLAEYFNRAEKTGQEVVVTYKDYDLAPGAGVVDLELGRMTGLTYNDWITDSTVDAGEAWGYIQEAEYKTPTTVIHYLIDNVSKNGHLLLNIGPKPDGTFPDAAKTILSELGAWLKLNGEAIYGTTPWVTFGEGPHQINRGGAFNEKEVPQFDAQDVRFTTRDHFLYAILLGVPDGPVRIEALRRLYGPEIQSVRMLGIDQELSWSLNDQGMTIQPPPVQPDQPAVVIKIERGHPFGS
jgi:alpha-L-fucosidase